MRRLAKLLPYLAILLLLVIALFAILRSGPVTKQLRIAISNELSRQTGRNVSIGQVAVGLTGSVGLEEVEVRNKDGSSLLRCPKATVWLAGARSWLGGKGRALEVKRIKLTGPEVMIARSASGNLDISDLMKRKPEAKPFRGAISVVDGRVEFRDLTRGGVETVLEGVSLTVEPLSAGGTTFRLRARATNSGFSSLEVSGRSDGKGGMKASGSVRGLDLAYAMGRLPETRALSISAGRAEVEGGWTITPGGSPESRLQYEVRLEATGAEISFPWLRRPVKDVRGRARLADGDLELEKVTGSVAAAPVEVSGEIGALHSPELSLAISASGLRVRQVEELLPNIYVPAALLLPSPVRVQARAEGPASEVVVSGRAEARVVRVRQVPWHEVVAEFRYSRGRLDITGLRAHGSPRRLEGNMSLTWGKGERRGQANVRLSDVPTDTLAEMMGVKSLPVSGLATLDGQFSLAGTSPGASGTITVEGAAWRQLLLGHVRTRFRYLARTLELSGGRFVGPMGSGRFSGKVQIDGGYAIRAEVESAPLEMVREALGLPPLCQGPFELADANLDISDQRIKVSEIKLSGAGAEARGRVEVRDWRAHEGEGSLSGELEVAGMPLSRCLPAGWGKYVGEGLAEGKLALGGSLRRPAVRADLALKLPVLSGVALEVGQAHLRYEEGRLYVEEVVVADGRSQARLTGEYRPDTGLALELVGDPLDIGALSADTHQRWGLALSGTARGQAWFRGAASDPEISFQVRSEALGVNDEQVGEVSAAGRLVHGDLWLEEAELRRGDTRIAVSGEVGLASDRLGLDWKIENLDLLTVQTIAYSAAWRLDQSGRSVPHRELYALLPRPLEGRLSAEGAITGTPSRPELTAHLLAAPVSFAGRSVEVICGRASASRARVQVNLEGFHETARASLEGFVEPQGEMFLSADIGNLDLRLVEPWVQWGVGLGGEATINFVISGKTREPVLVGDVDVDNLRLGPSHFEAARVLPVRLDSQGTLTIEEIRLRDGETEAYGKAAIPIRLPGRWKRAGNGELAAAELHVRKAALAPVRGMTPVRYDADLRLVGDRVLVGSPGAERWEDHGIRGTAGKGRFWADGEIQVKAFRPTEWAENRFDLAAELQQAQIEISGLGVGRLDGRLELATDPDTARPTLRTPPQQPIVLSNADLSPRSLEGGPLWPGALPFTPDLRMRVITGEGVWLRQGWRGRPTEIEIEPAAVGPRAGEVGAGYLDIGGRLSPDEITFEGRFQSEEGVLVFPNGALTLRRGEATIQREVGEKATRISIEAEADGRIGDYYVSINPEGQIYPPASSYGPSGNLIPSPFRWNARSLPHLDEGYVLALLVGPVAAPARGGTQDLGALLRGPGESSVPGEITSIMLPSLGGALGLHEFSVDLAFRKPVRLRVGERLFSRVTVSYASALSGPVESRSLRVDYEVTPRLTVGWSRDESERALWEVQSFVPF